MTLFGCKHRHRSRPLGAHQECLDCGKDLTVDYTLTEADKRSEVQHYQHSERALTRISRKVLKWKTK